jgi:hypothetical protein
MSDAIEVISISYGSVSPEVPVEHVSPEVPLEHVLSSSSPSLFTEHLIHMNGLNDLLCACLHTKCTQTKKNRDSTKKYEYRNVVVGVPIGSP